MICHLCISLTDIHYHRNKLKYQNWAFSTLVEEKFQIDDLTMVQVRLWCLMLDNEYVKNFKGPFTVHFDLAKILCHFHEGSLWCTVIWLLFLLPLYLKRVLYILFSNKKLCFVHLCSDLRDDKQFFIDHPGAVPITTLQVSIDMNDLLFGAFLLSSITSYTIGRIWE